MTDQDQNTPVFNVKDVHKALKLWHKNDVEQSSLDRLLLYRRALQQCAGNVADAQRMVLRQALDALAQQTETGYEILDLRFVQQQAVLPTAHQLNIEESTLYKKQRGALLHLTEILNRTESALRQEALTNLDARLEPPNYAQLFGIDAVMLDLVAHILRREPPWLFMLNGLGGIGKTTLADSLLRQLVMRGEIDDFAWISARQERFSLQGRIHSLATPALTEHALVEGLIAQVLPDYPLPITDLGAAVSALQQQFRALSYLIVVDNLETVIDVESLLPILRRLADPAQLVLTSRKSLYGEPDIFHLSVPGLSEADASDLIRYEASLRNLPELASASDESLRPIYATVGGNPLALRLIIGQTHIHSLDTVLENLRAARGVTVETLYTFIYENIWRGLDEYARRALLAMPLVPESGADMAYLVDISALTFADMTDALNTLVTLNLVDKRGSSDGSPYTIHNLTRSFLQEQVARWM